MVNKRGYPRKAYSFERVLKDKEKKTGCTIHYVNEKLDNGKNIIQKIFFISK